MFSVRDRPFFFFPFLQTPQPKKIMEAPSYRRGPKEPQKKESKKKRKEERAKAKNKKKKKKNELPVRLAGGAARRASLAPRAARSRSTASRSTSGARWRRDAYVRGMRDGGTWGRRGRDRGGGASGGPASIVVHYGRGVRARWGRKSQRILTAPTIPMGLTVPTIPTGLTGRTGLFRLGRWACGIPARTTRPCSEDRKKDWPRCHRGRS